MNLIAAPKLSHKDRQGKNRYRQRKLFCDNLFKLDCNAGSMSVFRRAIARITAQSVNITGKSSLHLSSPCLVKVTGSSTTDGEASYHLKFLQSATPDSQLMQLRPEINHSQALLYAEEHAKHSAPFLKQELDSPTLNFLKRQPQPE